jgi:lysocardiolipin and lysophospholipid acyltransferase
MIRNRDAQMLTTSSRRGQYGQDIYSLRAQYFEGRSPPSVSMYWRRFAIADIPVDEDAKVFEAWLRQKWDEKDQLLEQYQQTGRFPADDGNADVAKADGSTETKIGREGHQYIETGIKNKYLLEFMVVYVPLIVCLSIAYVLYGGVRLALSAI